MSCRKVRLVVGVVRKMNVAQALSQLKFINKAACRPVADLLKSAIANAENNFNLKKENLIIKEIMVDGGPNIKRWRPRAFGRAAPIMKHTCHISIVLEDPNVKTATKKIAAKDKGEVKKTSIEEIGKERIIPEKEAVNQENIASHKEDYEDTKRMGKHRHMQHLDKKTEKNDKGFLKKIFNRKAG